MMFGMRVARRVLTACALAAGCALAGGCAFPVTPSPFPSVLSDPAARSDTTLSQDQVKQAVDDLVSERKRLCMEQIADEGADAATPDCAADTGAIPSGALSAGTPAKP
jgi:hypothetical protein